MGDTTTLRRTATASIAAVVLAFALTGCGSSDDSSSSSADNTASASAAPSDTSSDTSNSDSSADSGDALSDYVKDAQASIPKLKKTYSSTYSDIAITGAGDSTLVYTYTYKQSVDPGAAKKGLGKMKKTLQQVCDSQVFPEMKTRGISSPKVTYTYLNSDGSKLWSHTFTPSK